jgi:hypothetical protein
VLWNAFYNTAGTNIEDIPLLATKRGADPYENFGMTARQSRFGLRYQGPEVMGGKLSGNVELDLFGGSAALGNGVNMDLVRLRLPISSRVVAIRSGRSAQLSQTHGSDPFWIRQPYR